MFSMQTNKGTPPADAAEGSIHMQISIDSHSSRECGEHEYRSVQANSSVENIKCCRSSRHNPPHHHHHPSSLSVVTDGPELKQVDQILLKQAHTAAATFILEAVRQNADRSTIR